MSNTYLRIYSSVWTWLDTCLKFQDSFTAFEQAESIRIIFCKIKFFNNSFIKVITIESK